MNGLILYIKRISQLLDEPERNALLRAADALESSGDVIQAKRLIMSVIKRGIVSKVYMRRLDVVMRQYRRIVKLVSLCETNAVEYGLESKDKTLSFLHYLLEGSPKASRLIQHKLSLIAQKFIPLVEQCGTDEELQNITRRISAEIKSVLEPLIYGIKRLATDERLSGKSLKRKLIKAVKIMVKMSNANGVHTSLKRDSNFSTLSRIISFLQSLGVFKFMSNKYVKLTIAAAISLAGFLALWNAAKGKENVSSTTAGTKTKSASKRKGKTISKSKFAEAKKNYETVRKYSDIVVDEIAKESVFVSKEVQESLDKIREMCHDPFAMAERKFSNDYIWN